MRTPKDISFTHTNFQLHCSNSGILTSITVQFPSWSGFVLGNQCLHARNFSTPVSTDTGNSFPAHGLTEVTLPQVFLLKNASWDICSFSFSFYFFLVYHCHRRTPPITTINNNADLHWSGTHHLIKIEGNKCCDNVEYRLGLEYKLHTAQKEIKVC